jgi:hypothetical protein
VLASWSPRLHSVKETQMSNSNREIVHYLRNDLRIATTLARLKREQSDQAALRVVELQRRLMEAESQLRASETVNASAPSGELATSDKC